MCVFPKRNKRINKAMADTLKLGRTTFSLFIFFGGGRDGRKLKFLLNPNNFRYCYKY